MYLVTGGAGFIGSNIVWGIERLDLGPVAIADRLRAWVPDLRVAYSIRSEAQLRRFVARGIEGGAEPVTVAIRESLLHSSEEVRALKRYARAVTAWTVDDADRGLELAAWGVDGVVSNHVAVLNAL